MPWIMQLLQSCLVLLAGCVQSLAGEPLHAAADDSGGQGGERGQGVTLTFVFDSTGSMSDELSAVKTGIQAIFRIMLEHPDKPIFNYALVPFNDPSVGPAVVTEDAVLFNASLHSLGVSGGGDCPELALTGVELALRVSRPHSFLYVFTDASAKDLDVRTRVEDLVQRTKSQVVFLLTGECNGRTDPAYQVYESIAAISSGQVFNLLKDEVNKVLPYIEASIQRKGSVPLLSKENPAAGLSTMEVPVDDLLGSLEVSVSGGNPRVQAKDPDGITQVGTKILDLLNALVVRFLDPKPGKWSVDVRTDTPSHVRVTAESTFSFVYGFSRTPTQDLKETSPRPLLGTDTALLVKVTDHTHLSHLTKVFLLDTKGEVLRELQLTPVPGKPRTYMVDMFMAPRDVFYVEIHGRDTEGKPVVRRSRTGVTPQPPALPIVTMATSMTVIKKKPVTMTCHVESLVPFTVTWFKDGAQLQPPEEHGQSAEVRLNLTNPGDESEGIYTCSARNTQGVQAGDTRVTVTAPPPVVRPGDTRRLRPGTEGILTCAVDSDLEYKVTWFKVTIWGDIPVISDPRFRVDTESGEMVIDPVGYADEGIYRCTAQSKAGQGQGQVSVKVIDPVHVTVEPAELNFTGGSQVVLHCVAGGSQVVLRWFKDGAPISEAPGRVLRPSKDGLDLVLEDARAAHEGTYECEARNEVEKDVARSRLTYVEKPIVRAVQGHVIALESSNVTLECEVTGVPAPRLSWVKDGEVIVSQGNMQVSPEGTLLLVSLQKDNAGSYQCKADNGVATAQDDLTLVVATRPRLLMTPRATDVPINSQGYIPCEAEGIPPPVVTWERKDGGLVDPRRFTTSGSCSLNISDASAGDEGIYVVTARNPFGIHQVEVHLAITGIVRPALEGVPWERTEAVVGEFRTLACAVAAGYPRPEVAWMKDGRRLHVDVDDDNDALTMYPNGSLLLSNVSLTSLGTYVCEATNVGGQAVKVVQLQVLQPPVFSQPPHTVLRTRKGRDILLACTVQGTPTPMVGWLKDGWPLAFTASMDRVPRDDSLLLRGVKEAHNGSYHCAAENIAGHREVVIDLLVQDPPRITPLPHNEYPIAGSEEVLTCHVTAFPPATIEWLWEGQPLSSDDVTITKDNTSITFEVREVHTGLYECVATNAAGQDRRKFGVLVLTPPVFSPPDEVLTVTSGLDLSLHCYVDAFPRPYYTWSVAGVGPLRDAFSSTLGLAHVNATAVYLCEASNYAGSDQKVFYVRVNVAPEVSKDLPSAVDLPQGSDYSVTCHATGSPPPQVTWLKDGNPLPAPPDGESATKDFLNVTQEDTGLYSCQASNQEGRDESSVFINVLYPPVMEEDEDATHLEVEEGHSVLVACPGVDATPPLTVNWFKDGRYLKDAKGSAKKKVLNDLGRSFKVKNATSADAGVYTCEVSNALGAASADVVLSVLKKPRLVAAASNPVHIYERRGIPVTLNCTTSGNPRPKVSWFLDGHVLMESLRTPIQLRSGDAVLHIPGLLPRHVGNYTCKADNKVGSVTRTFVVDLYEAALEYAGPTNGSTLSHWSDWSPWSRCSAPCGASEQVRERSCLEDLEQCDGKREEWRECLTRECPVDGGWSRWSQWSPCTTSCGSSRRFRYRRCNNPSPRNGGNMCHGTNGQHDTCHGTPCPVDGQWTPWTAWEPCGGLCSHSRERRVRHCTQPGAAFGGGDCEGSRVQERPCVQAGCPVDGWWSEWTEWGACSRSCGRSVQERVRTCTGPQYGGEECEGDATEVRECPSSPCDGIPLQVTVHLTGSLNNVTVDMVSEVSVGDLEGGRVVTLHMTNVLAGEPGWFPYTTLVVQVVQWLTAYQSGAVNGNTLTRGHFTQRSKVKFDTGHALEVTSRGSHGNMHVFVTVDGNVPLFPPRAKVTVDPYQERHVQSGPGEVMTGASAVMASSGLTTAYKSTSTITYSPGSVMPSRVQTLSMWGIQARVMDDTRSLQMTGQAAVSREADVCPEGYHDTADGHYCQDTDECTTRHLHQCHVTQSCGNIPGSYECTCPTGMTSAGVGAPCVDVDECSLGMRCSHRCVNTDGSYKCVCPPGLFLRDDGYTCAEAEVTPWVKGQPWYPLSCPPGQEVKEGFCYDRDACEGEAVMCSWEETCVSLRGLYSCLSSPCPVGYTGNRDTRACEMSCSEADRSCETGATVKQAVRHMTLTPDTCPVHQYKDMTNLEVRDDHGDLLPRTVFKVLQGDSLRVRLHGDDGIGVLYSVVQLPCGSNYRAVVLASSYDDTGTVLLYSTKFIVVVRLSDDMPSFTA